MRTEDFNNHLREHKIHVFSTQDAAKILSKSGAYTSKFLSMDKYLKRAENGVYYTKDATEYEVASRIIFPSYVSLVSALRFHNLTEQMPHVIFVMSTTQHRSIKSLNGFEVRFKKLKKSLFYGYNKIDDVFVADPEKAVIDMIYLNEFVEYAEEAVEENNVNAAKLQDYAARTGIKKIIKKTEEMLNARQE